MPSAMPKTPQLYRAGEQLRVLRRATSLRGQSRRHLLIGVPLAFQTSNLGFELAKIAQVDEATDGARPPQCADGPPTPDNPRGNRLGRTSIPHDFVDQTPQHGLALGATARVLWPQRGKRLAQRSAGVAQGWGDVHARLRVLGTALETRVLLPRLLSGLEGGLPALLQFRRHQAVGRVDFLRAPARLLGRMRKPLEGVVLRSVACDLLLAALLAGGLIEVQLSRGQGLQEGAHHVLVHGIGAEALTHRVLCVPAQRVTEILIAAFLLDHHCVTTAAARDQPVEEGRPLAGYPPAFVLLLRGIGVIDTRLHACKRLPRHGGGGTVVHEHLPLGEGPWTRLRAPTARGHLALRFAIRQGARIRWMAHDRHHRRHGGRAPHRGAVAMAAGEAEPLVATQAHHLTGRAPLETRLADQAERRLHGPIGIFDHDAVVVAPQPGW